MRTFLNGLFTGLILQTAIGPVFLFVMNLSLQKSVYDGLIAAIAVTIADYIYISLSILGIGKLLESKKIKKIFVIISSTVLIIFGLFMMKNAISENLSTTTTNIQSTTLFASFITTFFLAVSNPILIVFNTSLFTAKAAEYNYTKKELVIFGIAFGLATIIFLGSSSIFFSLIKKNIPVLAIKIMKIIISLIIITYGTIRIIKLNKN